MRKSLPRTSARAPVVVGIACWALLLVALDAQATSSQAGITSPAPLPGAGVPVDVEFREEYLGRVVARLATIGGFEVVLDTTGEDWRRRQVDISFDNTTVQEALQELGRRYGLAYRRDDDGALRVRSGTERGAGEAGTPGREGRAYRAGAEGVVPPVLLNQVNPSYTPEATRAGIEGDVWIEAIVDTGGRVIEPRVLRGLSDPELNRRAVQAVREWRFRPGTKDGVPVPVIAVFTTTYRLHGGPAVVDDPGDLALLRTAAEPEPAAGAGALTSAEFAARLTAAAGLTPEAGFLWPRYALAAAVDPTQIDDRVARTAAIDGRRLLYATSVGRRETQALDAAIQGWAARIQAARGDERQRLAAASAADVDRLERAAVRRVIDEVRAVVEEFVIGRGLVALIACRAVRLDFQVPDVTRDFLHLVERRHGVDPGSLAASR